MGLINEYLKKIKEAIYGEEVRNSIHDAIEQCYKDATGHPESVAATVKEIGEVSKRIDNLIATGTAQSQEVGKTIATTSQGSKTKINFSDSNVIYTSAFDTVKISDSLFARIDEDDGSPLQILKEGLYYLNASVEIKSEESSIPATAYMILLEMTDEQYNKIGSPIRRVIDFPPNPTFTIERQQISYLFKVEKTTNLRFIVSSIADTSDKLAFSIDDIMLTALDWKGKQSANLSELHDLRIGADGVVHNTAGEAVRKQIGNLTEDLVTTQKAYLVNPKITNNLYVNAEGTITGYDGWDLADIPVLGGDKIIIYSPTDSKYNAMYFANYANFKNVELKNGLNYIDIPDGYRSFVVSNEREIMKKVRFLVFPMQVINSNNEKLKKADKGKVLFNKVPYTYINNVDGNEINSDTYSSSDFIELTDCKNFVIECQEDSYSNALYDENKNFIQSIEYKKGITEFEKPTNAKYLRISCHTDFLEKASVIFDSSISYRNFTHNGAILTRVKGWESDRETIIAEAYNKLLNAYKENPDIIPIFVCTDSHRWSPQHPQRYVNNIDTDGMKIANINLGDDVTEHWDDLKFDTIYNNIRRIKNYIGVCGNHDKWSGNEYTEYYLRRIFTTTNYDAKYIKNSKRCCYSVKVPEHAVKYIIFDPYYAPNSGIPMVSIPTSVATWLISELSLNDSYDVIFLNHQPLTDNNIYRNGTKQSWKMESYESPIFSAIFEILKNRKNKRKGTYTDTDGIAHQYDFSGCKNDLLCLLHGHSHEELYYTEDGLTSYICDWDGAETTGYKSTFIGIDRDKGTLTAWIAKGSEKVEEPLVLNIN